MKSFARAFALFVSGILLTHAVSATEHGPHEEAIAPFIVANAEFTLTHELIHVLIDEIGFPVLSREEDQADYLAVTFLLGLDDSPLSPEMVQRFQAVIDAWRVEWTIVEQDQMDIPYSDPHALEIQRLHDMACLTFGHSPDTLGDFRIENELPRERADLCPEDYLKAANGLEFLRTTLGKTDPGSQLTLRYEAGDSLSHEQYGRWLRENSMIRDIVARIDETYAFPRPITIRVRSCGQANAYWEPDNAEVIMCYGLMDRFVHLSQFRQEYAIDRREWTLGVEKAKSAFK